MVVVPRKVLPVDEQVVVLVQLPELAVDHVEVLVAEEVRHLVQQTLETLLTKRYKDTLTNMSITQLLKTKTRDFLDNAAVSIFVYKTTVILVELTNTVFVNSTNITTNIEPGVLSRYFLPNAK